MKGGRKAGRGADQFPLRLPEGMRDAIKAAADEAGRSMNAEIVARLDDSFLPRRSTDRASVVVRIEALPPGSEIADISIATFLTSFDQALKASLIPANPARNVESSRPPDALLDPIDDFEVEPK